MTDEITNPDLSHILAPLRQFAVPLESLNPDPKNAREHSHRNIDAIQKSMAACGQDQLLVVQKQGMIVRKGNGRVIAAKALGWTHIAVLVVEEDDVSAVQRAIADNRASDLAGTNDQIMAELLKFCVDGGAEVIGFTDEEQTDMLLMLEQSTADAASMVGAEGGGPGSDPTDGAETGTKPNVIHRGEIIFDDEGQRDKWHAFVRALRKLYPDEGTIGARVTRFIAENG